MTDARANILGTLRATLAEQTERPEHPGALPPRLAADRLTHFIEKAEKAAATVTRLPSLRALPAAVTAYLRQQGLPARLAAAPHPLLRKATWPKSLRVEYRAAQAEDGAAITVAAYGVAETGSVAMVSGPDTPTTLNFLPDHLMIVLPVSHILGHPEQVWSALRADGAPLPRAVNFVTGPSRTADVEQKMQLGAHGPRSVQIMLLEGGSD